MTQLEVQRLVEDLSYVAKYSDSEHWNTIAEAASELRRLHAQRDALLEALKRYHRIIAANMVELDVDDAFEQASAAIRARENT